MPNMKFAGIAIATGAIFYTLNVADAIPPKDSLLSKGKSVFEVIKQIPEHATIEYHVADQPVQVLNIPAGIYEISIKKLR
jgi:hypothetical protein